MPEHPLCSFQEGVILSRGALSNQYVEKSFLTLLALSLLLHIAGFVLLYLWPAKPPQLTEPTFIDLQDMPELKTAQPRLEPEKIRPSDQRRRVLRETSPRREQSAAPPRPATPSSQERLPRLNRAAVPPGICCAAISRSQNLCSHRPALLRRCPN